MTSDRLKKFYKRFVFWSDGLQDMFYCHQAEKSKITWTEGERNELRACEEQFCDLKKRIDCIMVDRIGKAIVLEIKIGSNA